jgi:hypothetical protein
MTTKTSEMSSAGVVKGWFRITAFMGAWEVRTDGWKIHFFCENYGPVSRETELEVAFQ